MNRQLFNLHTLRLSMGGALLGVALMGLLLSQFPYHDELGAVLGGISVLVAKARHLF